MSMWQKIESANREAAEAAPEPISEPPPRGTGAMARFEENRRRQLARSTEASSGWQYDPVDGRSRKVGALSSPGSEFVPTHVRVRDIDLSWSSAFTIVWRLSVAFAVIGAIPVLIVYWLLTA